MIAHVELLEARHRPQARERRLPREGDLDPSHAHADELGERADDDEAAFADDPHAVADVLDLGEDVR